MRYWFRGLNDKRIYSCSAYPYQGLNDTHSNRAEPQARNSRIAMIVGLPWGKYWWTERVRVY